MRIGGSEQFCDCELFSFGSQNAEFKSKATNSEFHSLSYPISEQ